MAKSYGKFSLTVEPGTVHQNEVVGVLGANGLGKTTFAKMLAERQDVKISYKPQYLDSDFAGTVAELLGTADRHDKIPMRQKGNERLMERSVKNLPGGELE